jgi:cell division protein FtsW
MALLILTQPDFGTMFVVVSISAVMLFAGGLNFKYAIWGFVSLAVVLYLFIHFEPYRAERLMTFLNPEVDPKGISYQVNQSLLAIGAGGPWGYGYGLSRQKYNYLPASYTDSIFAVTVEELGFWGGGLIILGFTFLGLRGLKISKAAPDVFGEMLAVGITAWLVIQAIVNIGALSGLLPLTGIPLPFFSYGSTALLMNMTAIGILLNISKQGK